VELTVVAPKGTQVTLPPVGAQLGEFDVVDHWDVADLPTADADGQRHWKRQLTLECISTGDLTIPAMEVQTRTGRSAETLRTEAIPVHVVSVLEDRADLTKYRDIRSVVDLQVPQPQQSAAWLWWVGGGLGGLAVSAATLMLVARRRQWLTPAAWATQQLDALRDSDVVRSGDSEVVTSELSSILRSYLEMQFEIAAPTQTTQELLETIKQRAWLTSDQVNRFVTLCQSTDLAKFAGLQMAPSELISAIDQARELIIATASEIVQSESELETN
jgi:hypothetical protein